MDFQRRPQKMVSKQDGSLRDKLSVKRAQRRGQKRHRRGHWQMLHDRGGRTICTRYCRHGLDVDHENEDSGHYVQQKVTAYRHACAELSEKTHKQKKGANHHNSLQDVRQNGENSVPMP